MKHELKKKIDELRAEVVGWPKDQRGSFAGGVSIGLLLAAVFAKDAGCEILKDNNFRELLGFLNRNCPPVKRRNEAAQKSKPARDQLYDDTKELVRRAIAGRLGISKDTYDTSWEAWEDANKHLLTAIAIANRKALDDAIADIQTLHSIVGGGDMDRETVKAEVKMCYEKFPIEIASIERFNELSERKGFKQKDLWIFLRSNTPLISGHDDDEMREIDARYKSAA